LHSCPPKWLHSWAKSILGCLSTLLASFCKTRKRAAATDSRAFLQILYLFARFYSHIISYPRQGLAQFMSCQADKLVFELFSGFEGRDILQHDQHPV
jgi:hypothetical protein